MEMARMSKLASELQDRLVDFIRAENQLENGFLLRDIRTDNHMLIFYDEPTWRKFVDVLDILGMDFTTGEPDGDCRSWYIDFEFSDGISN